MGSSGSVQSSEHVRSCLDHLARLAATDVSSDWTRRRGLEAVARHLGADHVRVTDRHGRVRVATPGTESWPAEARWGLPGVRPEQFLFVAAAERIPCVAGGTLGDLGVRSVLHLPVCDRGVSLGALDAAWCHRVERWDDEDGPLVRNVARLLLLDDT